MNALHYDNPVRRRGRRAAWILPAILAAMLVLLASTASAQWTTQSPLPTHLDICGVAAPTAQRVFVATDDNSFDDGGALFESADGGATWSQRAVPFGLADPLNGIFFLDASLGWVFGNQNYRTTDGGTTWTQLPLLGSTYFMRFHSASFGHATGNFGSYVSRDGGLSWEPSPAGIVAFAFADPLLGLGVAETGLYRTTDGGATFDPVHEGAATAVAFLSGTVAVGIVDDAFVRSTDGGATWTSGAAAAGRDRLAAVSAEVALAWGRTGGFPDFDDRILRSADGGLTWTDLGEPMPAGVLGFAVLDPQTVVAADRGGDLFRSPDAGQTWTLAFGSPGPQPSFLTSALPVFADAQTGYFGYGPGFVIKTTDGGVSWSQISSGTGQPLDDVGRFASGDLIAVGASGTLVTRTGDSPWILHEAFTTLDLVAVQIVGPEAVVVLDSAGRVYRSADAGATWTAAAATPPGLDAGDLHFTDLFDGWVTGSGFGSGALFHTTDGGDSWTPVPDVAGVYVAVDFAGESGWAANVGGNYVRTLDGGETWLSGNLPGDPVQIYDMEFSDVSIGYAVGWGGYAARSDDGGATWEVLPTPNATDQLTDIDLLGANELWASTFNDVAYYSATGGQNWAVLEIGSGGSGSFAAIAATPGGDAWTVGDQGAIEYFAGPPPPPLNRPPDASFDFVTSGLTVDFTDTSSDPDGVIVSWSWDFDDGTTSNEQHPTHTFETADTYLVRLTVTDDDGDTGSAGRAIVVQPGPGGTFGDFTEVTPLDPLFVTPQDEDFWVVATAPADYDGDGDLDVAVFGYYVVYNESVEDRLVLFRNDGQAGSGEWEFAYIDVPIGSLHAGASDLAWGDADGDGDQDLAVGSNGQATIYRNDSGALVPTSTVLPPYYEDNDQADFDLRSLTWADYDNDGDPDLLMPSAWDDAAFAFRTKLLRNDGADQFGNFVFTETDSVFAPTTHAQSAWADFDGDQDVDLLLVNVAPLGDDGFIRRYRNDGGGAFVGEDILGALTIEHGEAQWGDYDADGDLDVLVAGHLKELDGSFTQALRIYRNDAETFLPLEVIECVPCEGWFDLTAATWADYDSDGDMDILLAGTYNSGSQIEGRARVYANEGGVFTDSGSELPAPRASGDRGGTFSWLDLDGDGDLDYFIAGQYFVPGGNGLVEAQMHAYRNDVPGQNDPPSAPARVVADVLGAGTVLVSWQPAGDDLTPGAALTYDLELLRGGLPGAIPRRLPEPGNVSAVTEWLLTGLADGAYEWRLRAVDSAYNGGPVATGAFTVGDVTSAPAGDGPPRGYAFAKNHPNPFNPSTTFSFSLPEPTHVDLAVYDLEGQLVARLVDETRQPGVHEVRWDARGLASGTYLVRLSTAAFTRARSVTLLK